MASRAQNERRFKRWEELPPAGADMFANSWVAPVDALVTSKKLTLTNALSDSRKKFMTPALAS